MSTQLLHIHSIGYTANNNPNRARRSGEEFEGLIPAPVWQEVIVARDASVEKTVAEMRKVILESAWQTKRLSARLLGKDIYSTCGNIWEFLFSHILYKEDEKGKEELRTPALSWYLRRKRGIDCDDFSIFCSSLLYNLNIPHYLRIARYAGKDYFQHVYVVVPLKQKRYITIDAVLDEYDTEKPTAETKDFLIMSNSNLNGINVSVLSGVEDNDTLNEISGILEGADFQGIEELEGLESLEGPDELEGLGSAEGDKILGAIYNHMKRTRDVVRKNPQFVSMVEDPKTFGDMLDYGLRYWNTDKREEALGILADKEDELNRLQGLDSLGDNEETQLFYGIEGLGGVSVLGKAKAKKQFFKNIKKTVQKVKTATKKTGAKVKAGAKKAGAKAKKVAKKVVKVLIKTNPVTIAARAGMLAAMKTNFLKIAAKLKWGYLTEEEAQSRDFDMAEWRKSKASLTKAEKLFVDTLKGKAELFKKAILTGRAGGLKGINEELGVVTAAAAGASLTAAMPFIKKLVELVKLINPGKMLAKVKGKKLAEQEAKADTMPEASEDAESAQPDAENAQADKEGGSDSPEAAASQEPEQNAEPFVKRSATEQADESPSAPEDAPTSEETESTSGASANTPATKAAAPATATDVSTMAKVVDWVKENPGKTALIAGSLILLLTPARKVIGLGKPGKGKKHKGKNKKNPPKVISGVGKKSPKLKYKNNSRRGKGGGPRQITL